MRVRLVSRRSLLARYQATRVAEALRALDKNIEVEFLWRNSVADDMQEDKPLSEIGGKNLFVKTLEDAVLSGEADAAVHSAKDMPATLSEGLVLAAISERVESRDAIVLRNKNMRLEDTRHKLRVGTSSMRRVCQLRAQYPYCSFAPVRGNIDTRLNKLAQKKYDVLILAAAGMMRLNQSARIDEYIDMSLCMPAAGQGAIGVETRADSTELLSLFKMIEDTEAATCVRIERAVCAQLGADCHSALGVHSDWVAGQSGTRRLRLRAVAANPHGVEVLRVEDSEEAELAENLVDRVCKKLLDSGVGVWLGH